MWAQPAQASEGGTRGRVGSCWDMEGGVTPGLESLAPRAPGSQEGPDFQGAHLSKQESQEEMELQPWGLCP